MNHHLRVYDKVPIEYIQKHIGYDPETGKLRWLVRKDGRQFHKEPGHQCARFGYRRVMLNYKMVLASHIAFVIMEGRWPNEIDHINRDPSDNRWCNLRECTRSENLRNRRSWKWSR